MGDLSSGKPIVVEDQPFTDENFKADAIVVDENRAWLQLSNVSQRLCN